MAKSRDVEEFIAYFRKACEVSPDERLGEIIINAIGGVDIRFIPDGEMCEDLRRYIEDQTPAEKKQP